MAEVFWYCLGGIIFNDKSNNFAQKICVEIARREHKNQNYDESILFCVLSGG
jgi:hypothetical protein